MKLAVLGAGAWGTALAAALTERHAVRLWARDARLVADMAASRENRAYLPGQTLPQALAPSADLAAACAGADLYILATPSAALRPMLQQLAQGPGLKPLVWVCKGFEPVSGLLPHEVVAQTPAAAVPRAVLSGPSFAQEVAAGLPTALTLAGTDAAYLAHLAAHLHTERLRLYTSTDVVGVEVGGALKNVMAIAAGISDGLGLGHNARAALLTRALAEMARLGLALGGRRETFMGLTGMGDLILTATGGLSRNRQVGLALAQGRRLGDVLESLGHVAEGVHSVREAHALGQRLQVELPITAAVYEILYEGASPAEEVQQLMRRELKAEQGA